MAAPMQPDARTRHEERKAPAPRAKVATSTPQPHEDTALLAVVAVEIAGHLLATPTEWSALHGTWDGAR